MATIAPKGENLRQAVKWIGEKRKEGSTKSLSALLQEAALAFNLSPKDEEFLVSFYSENPDDAGT